MFCTCTSAISEAPTAPVISIVPAPSLVGSTQVMPVPELIQDGWSRTVPWIGPSRSKNFCP